MRFAHTSEQEELSAVTRQFLAAKSGIDDLRRVIDTPAGYDPDVWAELAELGLLGFAAREREKLRMASGDVDIEDTVMVPHTVSASLVTLKQSGPRSP
jgi:alkylation response protein AidB-like acyl-CoA dehydrogenase